jgi:methylmalonyl-CoA mutase N-terminal domain/subunit
MKLVIDTFEFLHGSSAALQPDLRQRLSHSRSRRDGRRRNSPSPLRDGIEYVAWGVEAGSRTIDRFVPRMSFFFNAHNDFFEEIAKYRAGAPHWAREMKRRFGQLTSHATLQMRFHTQTAGVSLDGPTTSEQHRSRRDSGVSRSSRRHQQSAH